MITEALQHCTGVGPARLAQLHEHGIRTWQDVLASPDLLPRSCRAALLEECRRCLEALDREEVAYFVERLASGDKWRILHQFYSQASYFDIETTGLEYDSAITTIVCWHRGRLLTFVEDENLDDFLDVLDEVGLLVSFNGSTFDVPRLLDTFHIPGLPCPHLDLRWPLVQRGLRGSLKQIAQRLGVQRPGDLQHADGMLAISLWEDWKFRGDQAARAQLLRYCASDVLLLAVLAAWLAGDVNLAPSDIWQHLPAEVAPAAPATRPIRLNFPLDAFGPASPSRLRARRFSG